MSSLSRSKIDTSEEKGENNARDIENQKTNKITPKLIKRVLYWCFFVSFLVSLGVCVASITITSLRKSALLGLPLWQWMLLITSLLSGPLLSKLLEEIFHLLVENRIWAKNNKIYYMVELVNSAWGLLWFGIILLAWIWIMDEPRYLGTPPHRKTIFNQTFVKTFAKIRTTLVTLIIGAFLWLLKDIMLLKAKSSFQIDRFKERVWKALLHQEVLNILTHKLPHHDNGIEDGKCMSKSKCRRLKDMPRVLEGNLCKDEESSWWINDAIKWLTQNAHVAYYYYDDQDAQNPNSKRKFIEKIEDINEAVEYILVANKFEMLKDKIMMWAKENGVEDKNLLSKEVFGLVDLDTGTIDINHVKLEQLVKNIYKHRETLSKALKSNRKSYDASSRLIDVLLVIVIMTLGLILLNLVSFKLLGLLGAVIAGSAFLIGDIAKRILFSVNTFDIGDICLIQGILVSITDIGILFTSTLTMDGEERYYSKRDLENQPITNYSRSHEMSDLLVFYPKYDMAAEIVSQIQSFLNDSNKYTKYRFVKEFLQDQEKLKITLHFQHTIISDEIFEREKSKSHLISKITDIICEIEEITRRKK